MFAKADAADAVSAFCVMSNNYGGSDMIKVIGFDIGGTLMEYKNMPNVWIDYYKTGFETPREIPASRYPNPLSLKNRIWKKALQQRYPHLPHRT